MSIPGKSSAACRAGNGGVRKRKTPEIIRKGAAFMTDSISHPLQKPWIRVLSTVLVLVVMLAIFFFSSQKQKQSERLSSPIGNAVWDSGFLEFDLFNPIRKSYEQSRQPFALFAQRLARKSAHVFIFTVLGFLLRICLESWFSGKKRLLLSAFLIGAVYAVSDEVHQLFVPGRTGSVQDILLDCGGVILGVLIAAGIIRLVRKKQAKAPAE